MYICMQIGWVTGPKALIAAVAKAHQFITFTVPSSLQRAVAYGLDNESSFFLCGAHSLHAMLYMLLGSAERNTVPCVQGPGKVAARKEGRP